MAVANRAKFVDKVYRLLRKQYTPQLPSSDRPVLQQAIFGVCLENAPLELAEAAYERLEQGFYDWNEVRVSSARELGEAFEGLPDPLDRGRGVKAILQSVFETHYQFDLEGLRRLSLGQAAKDLKKFDGVTPFVVAFVLQTALKGHAIPLDDTCIRAALRLGLVTEQTGPDEMRASLERLVPKNKGPAFCSLIRQLAFDVCLPEKPRIERCVLAEICPTAQELKEAAKSAPSKSSKSNNSRKATTSRKKKR